MKTNIEKRQHCVSVRMNSVELDELDKRRGRMRRGTYVRQSLLGSPPPIIPEINRKAYSELARSASNLNQIALRLNQRHDYEIQDVLNALRDFRIQLIVQ